MAAWNDVKWRHQDEDTLKCSVWICLNQTTVRKHVFKDLCFRLDQLQEAGVSGVNRSIWPMFSLHETLFSIQQHPAAQHITTHLVRRCHRTSQWRCWFQVGFEGFEGFQIAQLHDDLRVTVSGHCLNMFNKLFNTVWMLMCLERFDFLVHVDGSHCFYYF